MTQAPPLLRPEDDGAARHLVGLALPKLTLVDTSGAARDLATLADRLALFVYPATGVPGRDPAVDPAPGWDDIPGAPGCTSQALGYRAELERFRAQGFEVVGLSAQSSDEQRDFVRRHGVGFPLLSDPGFELAAALGLPTFTAGGRRFYTRLALLALGGRVEHVDYPVFPPSESAARLLAWLDHRCDGARSAEEPA